ncbi:GH92 family glycosyl hydrolase [Colwellia sp. 1_MG-2023]|uniref:GH92 family glycosyl hydrolase n=1 Tax=Colwellia sp. 1_MG-2023 TaxID=3062649 RepID=UPI0026E1191A|nr:GH92 family glycosyl hydrolase [Colwellia sp. 1_MG-2023]MDO6446966.1 GH92 family glycosyl hydrolase [Colwellia sp. 1_MG-2023]
MKNILIILSITTLLGCSTEQATKETKVTYQPELIANAQSPVDYVWPWLDSANSRWFYFNSASRPFGMVNLSPDTEVEGAWGSGYRYNTLEIKGFNHVHAWQLSALSVMPVSSDKSLSTIENDYFSAFSHDNEIVKPGYHKVTLDRYGIDVELTSTKRVGFHRYQFEQSTNRKVILDLAGKFGPTDVSFGDFKQINNRTFSGFIINEPTMRRPRSTPVYFYIELDQAIASIEQSEGAVLLNLPDNEKSVQMKVAISYVDEQGAKNNLTHELAHWNFDQVVSDSKNEWNDWLSKIQVTTNNQQDKVRFYTDLFHALQGRRTISDVDGRYSDQTSDKRVVKTIPLDQHDQPKFNHHNSDSFWGAQWTIQTLWPLAYPKVASDFGHSMLMMYQDGGFIPRGPSGGNYTHVMTGASSTPFFVSNYMKGLRDVDIELAYQGLKKNHMPGGTMGRAGYEHNSVYSGGLAYYLENGYVPYPLPKKNKALHQDGAGQTLEYAYQDWTLAQLAAALGKDEDRDYFTLRSQNYRHVFDTETGYMRPKDRNGNWLKNFDPFEYRHGFVESNASQMTWFVPHDIAGLAELMGGKEKAITKLNQAFEIASLQGFTSSKSHDKETDEIGKRVPINYGNQPSIQTAFIFNELGAPHLTQKWSREVIKAVYSEVSEKSGFNGDEDQGLMGSLSVLMKIGLFQVDGGTSERPKYQIGSPIFDKVTISLDENYYSGKTFTIETRNNSKDNVYIQTITLNDKPLNRHFLYHDEIVKGGHLVLDMSATPQ